MGCVVHPLSGLHARGMQPSREARSRTGSRRHEPHGPSGPGPDRMHWKKSPLRFCSTHGRAESGTEPISGPAAALAGPGAYAERHPARPQHPLRPKKQGQRARMDFDPFAEEGGFGIGFHRGEEPDGNPGAPPRRCATARVHETRVCPKTAATLRSPFPASLNRERRFVPIPFGI